MLRRHQILIFHRVIPADDPMDPYSPRAAWFDRLIKGLKRRYAIIPVAEAVERARERRILRNSISITFDDGYADNVEIALPILEKYNAPATFFIATGYLDGRIMWNDKIIETVRRLKPDHYAIAGIDNGLTISDENRAEAAESIIGAWKHRPQQERQHLVDAFAELIDSLPNDLMMTSEQLRQLSASQCATIGGHTDSHPILLKQPDDQARADIIRGKEKIKEIIGNSPRLFAYPNGKYGQDFSDVHADIVRDAGFDAALSTNRGYLDKNSDHYRIPRFSPWTRNLVRFHADMSRAKYDLM